MFGAIQAAYDHVGYPGEWELHHQGGAAGYAGREWIATPTTDDEIRLPMAYAWNPTVQGAKSEDTALVGEERIEILTETGDWPTESVTALDYDVTLPRPTVLEL